MAKLRRMLIFAAIGLLGGWLLIQYVGRNPPAGLGLTADGLANCPDSPNCVCSDCDSADRMSPLTFESEAPAAQAALKHVLTRQGLRILSEQENYLHAVATMPLMRFRDDLEFHLVPESKIIHFRSASRLGKSDLGKNRSRLRKIFAALAPHKIQPAKAPPPN